MILSVIFIVLHKLLKFYFKFFYASIFIIPTSNRLCYINVKLGLSTLQIYVLGRGKFFSGSCTSILLSVRRNMPHLKGLCGIENKLNRFIDKQVMD